MKTSKFNKSEILKKAWSLVRNNGYKLANALRTAWAYARNKANNTQTAPYKGDAEKIFTSTASRLNGNKFAALQSSLNRRVA